MFIFKNTVLVFSIFLFANMSIAQEYNGPKPDIDQILKNVANFSKSLMDGNAEAVVNAYTKDGKIFPDRRDIIEGQEGLFRYWSPPKGRRTSYHKVTPSELTVVGDTAYDYGYYEGTTTYDDGQTSK